MERDEGRPVSVSHYWWPLSNLNNLSSFPFGLSLSLHMSLCVPTADLDSDNFSLFILALHSSIHSTLLSGNKVTQGPSTVLITVWPSLYSYFVLQMCSSVLPDGQICQLQYKYLWLKHTPYSLLKKIYD